MIETLLPLQEKYGFKIGLHLSITSGYSDESYETLTIKDTNEFPFIKNIRLDVISKEELKTEIEHQINKLADMLGDMDKIEHLNFHHGIFYMHPLLLETLLEVLDEIKKKQAKVIFLRSPMTWSKSGLVYYKYTKFFEIFRFLPIKKTGIKSGISWIALKFGRGRISTILKLKNSNSLNSVKGVIETLDNQNHSFSYCFIDQYYGQANRHNLSKIIENMPDGEVVEFMLHLGYKEKDTDFDYASGINSGYYKDRIKELDVLIEHKNLLDEVKKVNYDPEMW